MRLFLFLGFFVILFNISLLIFFLFKAYDPAIYENEFSFFLKINLTVTLYLFLRYLLGIILGNIFDLTEEQSYFTFLKMSNISLISVLIFPLLILSNYTAGGFHKFLITFTLAASLGVTLFRYFVLIKNEKLGFNNLFYLFL